MKNMTARTMAVLPLAIALSACATTTDSHFAESNDLSPVWSMEAATMPVEFHGALAGRTVQQTAAIVPNGVAANAATASGDGLSLLVKRRFVVYMGGDHAPRRADFCMQASPDRTLNSVSGVTEFRAALCDGPRIVSYVKQANPSVALNEAALPAVIQGLKRNLVSTLPVEEYEVDED